MKELEDPESTRDLRVIFRRVLDVKEIVIESGFERVDALRMPNTPLKRQHSGLRTMTSKCLSGLPNPLILTY